MSSDDKLDILTEREAVANNSTATRLSLGRIGLSTGCALAIETISPPRKYTVKLIGYVDGRSVLVSAPTRDGKDMLFDKDNVLVVRLLEGKQICAFETKVVYRSIHPYTYYHLAWPDHVEVRQVRNAERIDTELDVLIDSDFDIVGDWPKKARLNNLSKTGARLVSDVALGTPGHEVQVKCHLHMSGVEKSLCLTAVIRNIETLKNEQSGEPGGAQQGTDETVVENKFVYGVQFLNMNGDTRLALANFIYENSRPDF